MKLNDVPIGETVIIKEINTDNDDYIRLFDIGITPNSEITPVFQSAFKDPRAYLVKESIVAIRDDDARKINVFIR